MSALAKSVLAVGLVAIAVWSFTVHFGGAGWIAFGAVLAVLAALGE